MNSDGGHVFVNDEAYGMAFLTVAPYDGHICEDPFSGSVEEFMKASKLTLAASVMMILIAYF